MDSARIRTIVQAGLIASLYAGLTLFFHPISYGPVQFRVSEALTVLPIFTPAAIPGLFIGAVIANALGPFGLVDIVLGSAATLIAAFGTYAFRKQLPLALASPVVINALIVSAYVHALAGWPYWLTVANIGLGELGVVVVLGVPLVYALRRYRPSLTGETTGA